jgi:hypothetical protein
MPRRIVSLGRNLRCYATATYAAVAGMNCITLDVSASSS